MALGDQTITGLTYGQILASITLVLALLVAMGSFVHFESDTQSKIADNTARIIMLERGKSEDRAEYMAAFGKVNDKLDLILIHNDQSQYIK
jgi:hypothetical protein